MLNALAEIALATKKRIKCDNQSIWGLDQIVKSDPEKKLWDNQSSLGFSKDF